jgi:hypothetical protein
LIVFDHSYAMLEDWPEAAQGLVSFLEAAPAGLSVALNLYPNATCNLDSCAVGACYEPLVDFGTLPDNTAALSSAIDAADLPVAGSGSPLFLALGGALQRATDHRNDTSRETAVVFVSDGLPNGCNDNANLIAETARQGFEDLGLRTFVIGVETPSTNGGLDDLVLEDTAMAGGTDSALFIVAGSDLAAELQVALESVLERMLACAP